MGIQNPTFELIEYYKRKKGNYSVIFDVELNIKNIKRYRQSKNNVSWNCSNEQV